MSWNGFEHNRLFVRQPEGYLEAGYPRGLGGEADARNVIADDFDGDGRIDLIIAEAERGELSARVMRNTGASEGHFITVALEGDAHAAPFGAQITLRTDQGPRAAAVIAGDSFASQSRPMHHFGLGRAKPLSVEVRWPDGRQTKVDAPPIDKLLRVRPPK
ncbi:MAG: CRTAC1 family protein [Myxococcales bacterium]|nr:CRTAC1 family protein [Myxococcales bacterium]